LQLMNWLKNLTSGWQQRKLEQQQAAEVDAFYKLVSHHRQQPARPGRILLLLGDRGEALVWARAWLYPLALTFRNRGMELTVAYEQTFAPLWPEELTWVQTLPYSSHKWQNEERYVQDWLAQVGSVGFAECWLVSTHPHFGEEHLMAAVAAPVRRAFTHFQPDAVPLFQDVVRSLYPDGHPAGRHPYLQLGNALEPYWPAGELKPQPWLPQFSERGIHPPLPRMPYWVLAPLPNQWPAERWMELGQQLLATTTHDMVILVRDEAHLPFAQRIHRGIESFSRLHLQVEHRMEWYAQWVEGAHMVVSADAVLGHLAVGYGVPLLQWQNAGVPLFPYPDSIAVANAALTIWPEAKGTPERSDTEPATTTVSLVYDTLLDLHRKHFGKRSEELLGVQLKGTSGQF
jgi:hypothetical protein